MNRILALTFCLGLALTPAVHADNKDKKHAKREAKAQAAAQHNAVHAARQNARSQRSVRQGVKFNRSIQTHQHANALRFQHKQQKIHQQNNAAANVRNWKHANRNAAIAKSNRAIARHHNNVAIRNRNSWYEASRRFNWHHRHDRSWWRHNYSNTRFVLFGGGYYFWNNGYWYPAYGYDPAYSTYAYDEPIYGYNNYAPGQVITNVQAELQNEGYYDGEIDGLIGPATRDALARYQADNGLYVTRAIDEPTLESLGLT